jgi:hypothetical protein
MALIEQLEHESLIRVAKRYVRAGIKGWIFHASYEEL